MGDADGGGRARARLRHEPLRPDHHDRPLDRRRGRHPRLPVLHHRLAGRGGDRARTPSSNSLFGALQVSAAKEAGLDPTLLAAANSSGGVLGKMISPQNLAIGAAAVGLGGPRGRAVPARARLEHRPAADHVRPRLPAINVGALMDGRLDATPEGPTAVAEQPQAAASPARARGSSSAACARSSASAGATSTSTSCAPTSPTGCCSTPPPRAPRCCPARPRRSRRACGPARTPACRGWRAAPAPACPAARCPWRTASSSSPRGSSGSCTSTSRTSACCVEPGVTNTAVSAAVGPGPLLPARSELPDRLLHRRQRGRELRRRALLQVRLHDELRVRAGDRAARRRADHARRRGARPAGLRPARRLRRLGGDARDRHQGVAARHALARDGQDAGRLLRLHAGGRARPSRASCRAAWCRARSR